jgi:hypothetical protein
MNKQEIVRAILISTLAFVIFGTVTSMWHNPFFIRKIDVNIFDYFIIIPYVILLGIYFAIKVPVCKIQKSKFGLVLGFIGFSCPTCNALFVVMFGTGPILAYFEPIRFYVGVVGILIMLWAVYNKFKLKRVSNI